MTTVRSKKELADALRREEDTIEIEGDLAKRGIKIRATGKVAWVVAFGAIGVAVAATLAAPATGGASERVAFFAAPAAVGVLGFPTTVTAVSLAVMAGGVASLSKLSAYKEVSRHDDRLVLKRS